MNCNSSLVEPGKEGVLEGEMKTILTYTDWETDAKAGGTSKLTNFMDLGSTWTRNRTKGEFRSGMNAV